jgi:hypothetical protein
VGMEEAARSIRVYEPQFIPGLLQTEDYASAVLSLGDFPIEQAERHVLLRTERQRRFREGKLRLWAIIDEAALRHPVAGIGVHLEQLRYLRDTSDSATLTLQVLPYGLGGHATPGGFSILRFADPDLADVVYVENLTSALYLDKQADVDRYLLAMERLSIMAHDPQRSREIIDDLIKELESARGGLRHAVGEEHVQRPHGRQLRGGGGPRRRSRRRQGLTASRRPGPGVPGGRVGRVRVQGQGRRILLIRSVRGRLASGP